CTCRSRAPCSRPSRTRSSRSARTDRRLRFAAVALAEHPNNRGSGHRLLPPCAAADPTGRSRRADQSLAGHRPPLIPSRSVSRLLAAGARLLHGPRPDALGPPLRVGDRRQRTCAAAFADALGGAALPPPPCARRRRGNRRRGPRPRPLKRPGVWHGCRLVHRRSARAHPALQLPAARHDRDNGGWFRNTTRGSNFWSGFYTELAERARVGQSGGIRPAFISDYLRRHGAHGWVTVDPGAWNTGDHHGAGFVQWTGSQAQRDALARVADFSNAVRAVPREALDREPRAAELIEQARWRVLRAQTSCNFYWGEAWVQRCHDDLDAAAAHLDQAQNLLRTG